MIPDRIKETQYPSKMWYQLFTKPFYPRLYLRDYEEGYFELDSKNKTDYHLSTRRYYDTDYKSWWTPIRLSFTNNGHYISIERLHDKQEHTVQINRLGVSSVYYTVKDLVDLPGILPETILNAFQEVERLKVAQRRKWNNDAKNFKDSVEKTFS